MTYLGHHTKAIALDFSRGNLRQFKELRVQCYHLAQLSLSRSLKFNTLAIEQSRWLPQKFDTFGGVEARLHLSAEPTLLCL